MKTILELNQHQKANLIVLIARTYHLKPEEAEATKEEREKMIIYLVNSTNKIELNDNDRNILVGLFTRTNLSGAEVGAYSEIAGALNRPMLNLMNNSINNNNGKNKLEGVRKKSSKVKGGRSK